MVNVNKGKWDASHRLWPLPTLPWIMRQNWNDLLFAHYPIKLEVLRRIVPNVLPLDSFNGTGWIGIVPFRMTGVRLRGVPPIKGIDQFPELNVRTYVTIAGKPGVYFFSLDATKLLAVWGARAFYHLPYKHADMDMKQHESTVNFNSTRKSSDEVKFVCTYRPISESIRPVKGTFEEWMAERYCLYTVNKKGVPLRCDILHQPWMIQEAEAEIIHNTLLTKQGIRIENDQPILHFSKRAEVRAWPLVRAID